MNSFKINRTLRLINNIIKDNLILDLKGYNVLTEVGSGNFVYTPLDSQIFYLLN